MLRGEQVRTAWGVIEVSGPGPGAAAGRRASPSAASWARTDACSAPLPDRRTRRLMWQSCSPAHAPSARHSAALVNELLVLQRCFTIYEPISIQQCQEVCLLCQAVQAVGLRAIILSMQQLTIDQVAPPSQYSALLDIRKCVYLRQG